MAKDNNVDQKEEEAKNDTKAGKTRGDPVAYITE